MGKHHVTIQWSTQWSIFHIPILKIQKLPPLEEQNLRNLQSPRQGNEE